MAYLLELLQPKPGHNLLDIGSGSGWQTALLAQIVGDKGQVTAMEIVPELCEMSRANVSKYNFMSSGRVQIHCRSGTSGYAANAPYDGVIAAAAGKNVPSAWLKQTKVGGRIVTPLKSSIVLLEKKSVDEWEREDHPGFLFVPLVD